MLKLLDLFSGIGGFSYGLESTGGFETVAFCEILPYCQKVLKKHWPDVPIHSDIKETDFGQYRGTIDVITGGYPCQPFSQAGKQRGEEDPRHLWPRMCEIIEQVRPTWVICENVYGHVKLGLDTVLLDLENLGYTTRTFIVPACGVNAPHKRDRLWIVAYSQRDGLTTSPELGSTGKTAQQQSPGQNNTLDFEGANSLPTTRETLANSPGEGLQNGKWPRGRQDGTKINTRLGDGLERCGENDTNPDSSGRRQSHEEMANRPPEQSNGSCVQPGQDDTNPGGSGLQGSTKKPLPRLENIQVEFERNGEAIGIVSNSTEPPICGVTYGFPGRVDRIKSLGNSVVPQVVFNIGKAILYAEEKAN